MLLLIKNGKLERLGRRMEEDKKESGIKREGEVRRKHTWFRGGSVSCGHKFANSLSVTLALV